MNVEGFNQLITIGGVVSGLAYAIVAQMLTLKDPGRLSSFTVGILSVSGALLLAATITFATIVLVRGELSSIPMVEIIEEMNSVRYLAYFLFVSGLAVFALGGATLSFLYSREVGVICSVIIIVLTIVVIISQRKLYSLL